jgi:hypothetical protein
MIEGGPVSDKLVLKLIGRLAAKFGGCTPAGRQRHATTVITSHKEH